MMESLLHCREWAGLPVTLYAIEKLVIDVTEQDLLRDIDWIIIPVANPDGYEFTHTNVRIFKFLDDQASLFKHFQFPETSFPRKKIELDDFLTNLIHKFHQHFEKTITK